MYPRTVHDYGHRHQVPYTTRRLPIVDSRSLIHPYIVHHLYDPPPYPGIVQPPTSYYDLVDIVQTSNPYQYPYSHSWQ